MVKPPDLNQFTGMVVKIHREIKARRQSTISRWSWLETVMGASASLAASFLIAVNTTNERTYMAAQLTAAILMLLLTWFSIHKLMRTYKGSLRAIYAIVAVIAFLSWSGNVLTLGVVPWLIGSAVVVGVLVWEKSNADKK